MREQLEEIAAAIPDPGEGLPDPVFGFICRVTPMINVDLLIQVEGRTLMIWREDRWGKGWHVPGGIIRYGEHLERRIAKVAESELGVAVVPAPAPCAILQLHNSGRGHFISLVYRCRLPIEEEEKFGEVFLCKRGAEGQVAWIAGMPEAIYPAHQIYRPLICDTRAAHVDEVGNGLLVLKDI